MAVRQKQKKQLDLRPLKGAFLALLLTVFSVLILAIVVKNSEITDETITVINQGIKILSIFAGAFAASRGLDRGHLSAGALAGGVYIVLGYLIFSLLEGRFGDILLMFADLAMGIIIGGLTGLIFGKLLGVPKENSKTKKHTKRAY